MSLEVLDVSMSKYIDFCLFHKYLIYCCYDYVKPLYWQLSNHYICKRVFWKFNLTRYLFKCPISTFFYIYLWILFYVGNISKQLSKGLVLCSRYAWFVLCLLYQFVCQLSINPCLVMACWLLKSSTCADYIHVWCSAYVKHGLWRWGTVARVRGLVDEMWAATSRS